MTGAVFSFCSPSTSGVYKFTECLFDAAAEDDDDDDRDVFSPSLALEIVHCTRVYESSKRTNKSPPALRFTV